MRIPQRFSVIWLLTLLVAACSSTTSPATNTPVEIATPLSTPTLDLNEEPPFGISAEFTTDFSKRSISFSEILSGGPPKDGIPPIDDPQFVNVAEATEWLQPQEPVIFVQVGEVARAYPLQILTWHEIVNDTVGELPLTVTFCPLCNTAIAFRRAVGERVLDFGTTGRLRYSNLIMYDRQTESWWQQGTGTAIAGELTGTQLEFYPAVIVAWSDFQKQFPNGQVLSRETGFSRTYGVNPYEGYDDVSRPPFLYRGPETPSRLPPVARVLAIELNGDAVAYPYDLLKKWYAVNDKVGGKDIVIFWQAGTASALDTSLLAEGRDVGAAAAFLSQLDGKALSFRWHEAQIVDDQTGSTWNVFGQAMTGELTGQQLEPVVGVNHFWFSWAAFKPETRVFSQNP